MGYEVAETHGGIKRLVRPGGNGADFVDLETLPGVAPARARRGLGASHRLRGADERPTSSRCARR